MSTTVLTPLDASFKVSNSNSDIHGISGTQAVLIDSTVTGTIVDANVERVQFTGASTDYTFKQAGNTLQVSDISGKTLIATVSLGSAAGSLTFSNGTAPVQQVEVSGAAPTITIGGQTVSATAAAVVTIPSASLDTKSFPVTPVASVVVSSAVSHTTLTTGVDDFAVTTASTFVAPILNTANTLQTGDTLTGSGADKLVATIANSQGFAILANTTGISTVQLHAQANSFDSTNNNTSQTNQVQIDAQNMVGVTRYEDNNSRSDLLIEDIRIKSSNSTVDSNNDRQEVILNADRTVNDVATRAAGTTAWEVTKDVTIAMVSTDPGHVDYGVYFDPNSLRAGESSKANTLTIQLLDIKGAQGIAPVTAVNPLRSNVYTGFKLSVDGVDYQMPIQKDGGPITSSYEDVLAAVKLGLKSAIRTTDGVSVNLESKVSAVMGVPFTKLDADTGAVASGGKSITLTSLGNALLDSARSEWITTGGVKANSNLYSNVTSTAPTTLSPLVTSDIIIDDVGRGSTGGNLVVGSLSIGDTSLSQGVDQFNVHVDRSSKLEAMNSTNNALREVYIDSTPNTMSNKTGIHNGNLTVMGQVMTGNNSSTNMNFVGNTIPGSNVITVPSSFADGTSTNNSNGSTATASGSLGSNLVNGVGGTSAPGTPFGGTVNTLNGVGGVSSNGVVYGVNGVGQPIPGMVTANGGSQFNQYGFNDVRVIDASAMTANPTTGLGGAITFNAAITQASIAKYMNLIDESPALAVTDNVNFVYTGSAQNDNITVALDPQAMAVQTNNLGGREDFTLSVQGGAGNDKLTVGIYTDKEASGSVNGGGNYKAAGNTQAWYTNQKLNNNITVSGGEGNDIISTPGAGDKNILGGTGFDTVYSDNTGRQPVSNPLNSMVTLSQNSTTANTSLATATWVENTANSFASDNLNNLESASNPTYALFLGKLAVKFDGYSSANVLILQSPSSGYFTTELQINQAIKAAINSDAVLNKLLIAQDGPANSLVITSKIDGIYNTGDIQFTITQPTATDIANSGATLATIYNTQHGVVGTSIFTGTAASIAAEQGLAITQGNGNAATASIGFSGTATTFVWSPDMANDGTVNGATASGFTDIVGRNSVTTSDNVINAGTSETGIDVVVLGTTNNGLTTLGSSNEVVSLAQNFGKQVVVHFDANIDAGQDVINFSGLFQTPAKWVTALPTTPVFQGFDVKVVPYVKTTMSDTSGNADATKMLSAVSALYVADKTATATIPGNNFKYDHVVLVEGSAPGFTSVYSVENGVAISHGLLSVLGLGGQSIGGNVLSMSTLLGNGSFNAGAVNGAVGAVTVNTVPLTNTGAFNIVNGVVGSPELFTFAAAQTGNLTLTNFTSADGDRIQFDLPTASTAITTLAGLNGYLLANGNVASVQFDEVAGSTFVNLGLDVSGNPISVELVGVIDPATVSIVVI